MNYALNTDLAREGSGSLGGRIQETGKYLGVIEWAREKTNNNGTTLIELRYVSQDNQSGNLTIYTANNKGEPLHGLRQIHALMSVLRIRAMNPIQGSVEAYDYDSKQVVVQPSLVLKELENKPVGLLLQKEFYTKESGEEGYQMNMFAPFTIDTNQTAKEVLDNKGVSEDVDKLEEGLQDRYRNGKKPLTNGVGVAGNTQQSAPEPPHPVDDFDDDIPF